jgi:hypothetical protein
MSLPGACNLWFCYLSVRLLLCRLALRVADQSTVNKAETRNYRLAMLRDAAVNITDFICSLEVVHFEQFWLPYVAHLLVTAATVLLRCILETENEQTANSCKASIRGCLRHLRMAQGDFEWDIADMFLERCEEAIERIAGSDLLWNTAETAESRFTLQQAPEDVNKEQTNTVEEPVVDEVSHFAPADSLDCIWESLWDTFDDPMALNL